MASLLISLLPEETWPLLLVVAGLLVLVGARPLTGWLLGVVGLMALILSILTTLYPEIFSALPLPARCVVLLAWPLCLLYSRLRLVLAPKGMKADVSTYRPGAIFRVTSPPAGTTKFMEAGTPQW